MYFKFTLAEWLKIQRLFRCSEWSIKYISVSIIRGQTSSYRRLHYPQHYSVKRRTIIGRKIVCIKRHNHIGFFMIKVFAVLTMNIDWGVYFDHQRQMIITDSNYSTVGKFMPGKIVLGKSKANPITSKYSSHNLILYGPCNIL
jgi:hypothetical protein